MLTSETTRAYWPASAPRMMVLACGTLLVATLPWTIASAYWVGQLSEVAFLALLVCSLNLSVGYAGQLAFGQVAVAAVAAYVVAYTSMNFSSSVFVTMPAGVAAALVTAAVIGAPTMRLSAWTLAVVTLFAVIVLPNVVELFPSFTGGKIGLIGIPEPTLFGIVLNSQWIYFLAVICLCAWTGAMYNFLRSRHGAALKTLRQSELLTSAVGISNFRLKLLVQLLAAVPAGIAGAVFIYKSQFISASPFSFSLVIQVVAASLLGGQTHIWGPVVGATILQLGPLQAAEFKDASLLAFGVLLVIVGLALPDGLTGLAERWLRKAMPQRNRTLGSAPVECAPVLASSAPTFRGALLEVRGARRSFGGIRAVDDISIVAQPGRVTALIGANGSGKTTLLNMVSGFVSIEAGGIFLDGKRIDGHTQAEIARMGIRRTFQTPIIPLSMTTEDVVGIARSQVERAGITGAIFRTPGHRRVEAADRLAARSALAACDLIDHAPREASSLPLGLRRLIEVARAIAAAPGVVLLDEPAAGLEEREIDDLIKVVRSVRDAGMTVVLVEHNFGVISAVADVVYVLSQGKVIAEGSAEEIAAQPQVIELYFGGRANLRPSARAADAK